MLGLPTPSESRIALRVTSDAQRHVRSGHPWVFDGSIVSQNRPGDLGDLGVIFDNKRNFVAIGLFDPDSPIRLKILHHGRPRQIDAEFWRSKITAAAALREGLVKDEKTTAYRLINGENDGLPGLVVDRYDDVLVMKIYSGAWFGFLPAIAAVLVEETGADQLALRLSRNVMDGYTFGCEDGMMVRVADREPGEPPRLEQVEDPSDPVRFLENGLKLEADVLRGQKTGYFLDQRDNRAMVASLSKKKSMLDVFSCSGGFALNAAAGGASRVHAIDQAPEAIRTLQANFEANSDIEAVAACSVTTAVADAFTEMQRLQHAGHQFDIIVIDPPSFAQKKEDIGRAIRAYRELTTLGLALLAPNGVLVQASCSSRVVADEFFAAVSKAADRSGYALNPFTYTEHAEDHPATFAQGSYLKAVFARPRPVKTQSRQRRTGRS